MPLVSRSGHLYPAQCNVLASALGCAVTGGEEHFQRKEGKKKVGGGEEGERKKKIGIVFLNSSLQIELSINSGELLAFHTVEKNPKQTAPQGTGLNQHLPAGSEQDVGGNSGGRGTGSQGTGALDQALPLQAGNCSGTELRPLYAGISPARSLESHSLQRSFCFQGDRVGGE